MILEGTKRRKRVLVDGVCCADRKGGSSLAPSIAQVYISGTMTIVATVASLILMIEATAALLGIYGWYPQFAAQQWFLYDELLTSSSALQLASGAVATALMLSRRSYLVAMASAILCTLSGASSFVISLIQPMAVLWESLLYYLLPLFIAPLAGTLTYL